jgi:hypothetical protein
VKRAAVIVLALAAAGCATPQPAGRTLVGRWGGQHVGLDVGPAGARLAYDCAAGTVDQPLVAAADGRFTATGTHTPGHGGPDRVGEVPLSYPARYSGRVRGDTMTLRVDVAGLDSRLGPFTLHRGAPANLLRCL